MFSYKKFQNIDIASCQSVQELDPVLVTRVYRNNWRNASKKCCQSVNKRCRKKEREEKTDKCKVFCVTSTRNNRNSEHQNNWKPTAENKKAIWIMKYQILLEKIKLQKAWKVDTNWTKGSTKQNTKISKEHLTF